MTFDMYSWGSYGSAGDFGSADRFGSADVVDHWLDDALRAVPLPDGFFARLSRLADAPPERSDDRDGNDRLAPAHKATTRGLSSVTRPREASRRGIRP